MIVNMLFGLVLCLCIVYLIIKEKKKLKVKSEIKKNCSNCIYNDKCNDEW